MHGQLDETRVISSDAKHAAHTSSRGLALSLHPLAFHCLQQTNLLYKRIDDLDIRSLCLFST